MRTRPHPHAGQAGGWFGGARHQFVCDTGVEVCVASRRLLKIDTLTLTIFAIGSLSQSIACMSCQLQYSARRPTGVEGVDPGSSRDQGVG